MSASDLFRQLTQQNRAMAVLDKQAVARVGPMVTETFAHLIPYLRVVVQNNPTSTPASLLTRPDVLAAIEQVLSSALSQAELQVADAAAAARVLANAAAGEQLAALAIPLSGTPVAGQSDYLDAVTARLSAAAQSLRSDLRTHVISALTAIETPQSYRQDPDNGVENVNASLGIARSAVVPGAVERALRDAALRFQLGVSAAAQRSYAEATEDAYRMAAAQHGAVLGKMWIANYKDGHVPCPSCAALSAQYVALDDEFHIPNFVVRAFKLFGKLFCPPAHPRCQCRLVPCVLVEPPVSDSKGAESPAGAVESPPAPAHVVADAELHEAASMPVIANLPDEVSASDVRAMSSSVFVKLLTALLALLAALVGRRRND